MSLVYPKIQEITGIMLALNDDEVEVLMACARRLAGGRREYGPLDLDANPRDWAEELFQETADAVVYCAILSVRAKRTGAWEQLNLPGVG